MNEIATNLLGRTVKISSYGSPNNGRNGEVVGIYPYRDFDIRFLIQFCDGSLDTFGFKEILVETDNH